MSILADIWKQWVTPDKIQKAAKVVGVSIDGLNIDWMNQEKMDKAEMLIAADDDVAATPSKGTDDIVDSRTPEGMRRNCNKYLKFKLQKSEERVEMLKGQIRKENEVDLNEIPGFLEPKKIRPKKKKSMKITQVHGSLSGCDILKKLEERERAIEDANTLKQMRAHAQIDLRRKFEDCKDSCTCNEGKCSMIDFKQCPVCFSVKKSVCSKKSCLNEDGSKPVMIRVNQSSKSKSKLAKESRKRKIEEYESDSDDSMFDDWDFSEVRGCSDIDESADDNVNMQLINDCDHITVDEKELPKVETEIGEECSKDFQMGTYVILDYEGELFHGEITEVYEDGVRVSCMEKSSSVGSTWRWPQKKDESFYPLCDVRFKNISLDRLSGTSRKVEYHVEELDNVWGDISVYM